jgi:hypothetical protein
MQLKCNVSPVRYEFGLYIPEDGILHSHRRENLKSNTILCTFCLSVRGRLRTQGSSYPC